MVGILLKVMHPGVRIPPLMPSLRFDLRDLRGGCEYLPRRANELRCHRIRMIQGGAGLGGRRAVSYKFEDLVNCNP